MDHQDNVDNAPVTLPRASLPAAVGRLLGRFEQAFDLKPRAYVVTFYATSQVIVRLPGTLLDAYALARMAAQSPDACLSLRSDPGSADWYLRMVGLEAGGTPGLIDDRVAQISEPLQDLPATGTVAVTRAACELYAMIAEIERAPVPAHA
jgi:hypothetical protein